jgi:hypothetical protein
MAVFPKSQSSLYQFAKHMLAGFAEHPELFPSVSPQAIDAVSAALETATQSMLDFEQAQAAAKNATIKKNRDNQNLKDRILAALHMAESDCINSPANLDYIGWAARRPQSSLEAPGQPNELSIIFQGQGNIGLSWRRPLDGSTIGHYLLERSDSGPSGAFGPWILIATSYKTEIKLTDQPQGLQLLYRVKASNPAGDSMASNVAAAII